MFMEMVSNGLVFINFVSGKHTATFKHISTSVEAKQQHNEKDRNNNCTSFMTLHILSSQTCVFQSLKRAGVKATLHQPSNGRTSPCAPASCGVSDSLVAVSGPCGPSLVLATSQLCEQLSFAPDVHGTHATATFSKRRLLLLLLLLLILLIIGVNAGAYEMH